MSKLVERFGHTGFAAISSVIWALPMAAWAGSSDLSPVDKTATPTIAFTIGAVLFVVWLILIANLGRIQVTRRQRRFFTLVHDGADELVRLIAEAAQDVEARRLTAPPATTAAVEHALAS